MLLVSIGMLLAQNLVLLVGYLQLYISPQQPWLNDRAALNLVGYELFALLVMWGIGRIRGWSFSTFGLRVSWGLTCVGLLLAVVMTSAHAIPSLAKVFAFKGSLTWRCLAPLLVINPFFEEVVEVGYVFHSLKKHGALSAILVSAFLRASLHVYLGLVGFLAVLVGGILCGFVYVRWRQLWPLLVAHSLTDLFVLISLAHHA